MATEIKCEAIDSGLIHVNGKEVRLDMNGNWMGKHLDVTEAKVFNLFLNSAERAGRIKIKKAIFTV